MMYRPLEKRDAFGFGSTVLESLLTVTTCLRTLEMGKFYFQMHVIDVMLCMESTINYTIFENITIF